MNLSTLKEFMKIDVPKNRTDFLRSCQSYLNYVEVALGRHNVHIRYKYGDNDRRITCVAIDNEGMRFFGWSVLHPVKENPAKWSRQEAIARALDKAIKGVSLPPPDDVQYVFEEFVNELANHDIQHKEYLARKGEQCTN